MIEYNSISIISSLHFPSIESQNPRDYEIIGDEIWTKQELAEWDRRQNDKKSKK